MCQHKQGLSGQRKVVYAVQKISAVILVFSVLLKMAFTCGYLAFWVYISVIDDQVLNLILIDLNLILF